MTAPSDRRWSATDRELVAETIDDYHTGKCVHIEACEDGYDEREMAAAVLDALTAAGWAPEEAQWERTYRETENLNRMEQSARAAVAEEIAADFDARRASSTGIAPIAAAAIARAHRTTPGDDHA